MNKYKDNLINLKGIRKKHENILSRQKKYLEDKKSKKAKEYNKKI